MPNPPKPTELKRLQGNPGKRKLPDTSTVVALPGHAGVPDAPDHLGDVGKAAWEWVWTSGGAWLSQTADLAVLSLLCEAMEERAALRDAIAANGTMTEGSQGQPRVNPAFSALRAVNAEIVRILSLIGFTPTDRARLGFAEVKKQSALEDFIAKRQARS